MLLWSALYSRCAGARAIDLEQPLDLAMLAGLAVDPFADQLLLAAHMVNEALDRLREVRHRGGRRLVGAALGDHLVQSLDCGIDVAAGGRRRHVLAAEIAHRGGEPILELGVEPVLRLARLQIEEAEDQRTGEAEQRGRERNPHAAERRREALLEGLEHRAGVAAHLEAFDHFADRADGLDQAPEGAEQAEEDQEAGHVARHVARLVETVRDRIHQAAHGLRGHRHAADAVAQDRRHWREQHRRALDRKAGIGEPEAVDPGDLGKQPQHLAEGEQDADQQHADDQGVEPGIGEECIFDLAIEDHHHQHADGEEDHHPHQEDPR